MVDQKASKLTDNTKQNLPNIPDKLYFTIGEVGKLCNLKSHVLRYWEQAFPQLNPSKRRGNRRYYQRRDVLMIREIMSLLYDQGFTIDGARSKLMAEHDSDMSCHTHYHLLQDTINNLENVIVELET